MCDSATILSSAVVWAWIYRCFRHFRKRPNFSVFVILFGSGYAGLGSRQEAGGTKGGAGGVPSASGRAMEATNPLNLLKNSAQSGVFLLTCSRRTLKMPFSIGRVGRMAGSSSDVAILCPRLELNRGGWAIAFSTNFTVMGRRLVCAYGA